MKSIWMTLLLSLTIAGSGCTAVKNSMRPSEKNSRWNPMQATDKSKKKKGEEVSPAMTMAAIWSDSVYEKDGVPSTRGFGGRIFFYDANNKVVPAEGELIVYCFDEDSADRSKADKKAIFRKDEFQSHLSDSGLGQSYSVWIPWDQNVVGGYRKSVTLIPIFKTADGRILKTDQSINVLHGKVVEKTNPQGDQDETFRVLGASPAVLGLPDSNSQDMRDGVSQASFNETTPRSASAPARKTHVRTSTLSLTRNLQRQLENAPPQTGILNGGNGERSADPQNEFAPSSGLTGALNSMANSTFEVPDASATAESAKPASRPRVFGAPGSLR